MQGKHEKHPRTKTERTKLFLEVMATALTILAVASVFLRMDGAVYLEAMAGAWLAAASVFHVLYAKKESRANSQKYMEKWVEQTADKYGADAAARFAEIVLQNSNQ